MYPRLLTLGAGLCLALQAAAVPSITVGGTAEALTVIAEDAPLRDVLAYVARHQRLTVEAHAPLAERIDVTITDEPLAGVLRRLLDDYNFTLALEPGQEDVASGRLWLYPRGSAERPDAGKPLRFGAAERDVAARLEATAVLAAYGGEGAFEALAAALADDEPAVRAEAVAGIGDLGVPGSAHLAGMALADPDARVREAAIDALAGIGSSDAADELAPLLGHSDPALRHRAVDALGEILEPRATRLLRSALGDPDPAIREAAADYLAERQPR